MIIISLCQTWVFYISFDYFWLHTGFKLLIVCEVFCPLVCKFESWTSQMISFYIITIFLNPYLLNYLNGLESLVHFPFLDLYIINFRDVSLKVVSQQYRAWSDCKDLYWWQRLITFGASRIRVKTFNLHCPVK